MQQLRFQRQYAEKRLEWLKMQMSNINNDGTPVFSTGLNSSGYSENHENLPEVIKQIENATALRRAEPFLMSDMLGDDVLFSMKQLVKKGRRHLKTDWHFPPNIVNEMPDETVAYVSKALIENIYSEGFNVRHIHKIDDGTAQFREPASLIINDLTDFCVTFEYNPLYDKKYFISSYKQDANETRKSITDKNVGKNATEKLIEKELARIKKAAIEKGMLNEKIFHTEYLTPEKRISKAQLRDMLALNETLNKDPKLRKTLSQNEKDLLNRAEQYIIARKEFFGETKNEKLAVAKTPIPGIQPDAKAPEVEPSSPAADNEL